MYVQRRTVATRPTKWTLTQGYRMHLFRMGTIALGVSLASASTLVAAQASDQATVPPPCTVGTWSQESAKVLPAMQNGYLFAVSVASAHQAWAVGYYFTGTSFGSLIEQWQGTGWSVVGTGAPNAQLDAVATFGTSHAVAVGNIYENNATVDHALISQWNGTTWSRTVLPLPVKAVSASLDLVSGSSASDIWAAGEYMIGKAQHVLLEHYNGSTWTKVSLPANAQPLGEPAGLLDLAPNDVWAVGTTAGSVSRMWHDNGAAWSLQSPAPPTEGTLTGSSDTDLWLTGFDSVEHWNGHAWNQIFNNGEFNLYQSAEGAKGATSLWTVGWTGDNPPETYIAENGVKVKTPTVPGFLQGIGTGFGLAFAVGYPNRTPAQPIVLASCD
jgi:hypothetical protein